MRTANADGANATTVWGILFAGDAGAPKSQSGLASVMGMVGDVASLGPTACDKICIICLPLHLMCCKSRRLARGK